MALPMADVRHPLTFQRGEFYLSTLISLGIFSMVVTTLVILFTQSFEILSYSKARITARHLAQEKIETIRNMPYESIGTVGGIPAGYLQQSETVTRNGMSYRIRTDIVYVDDPFDGILPDDLVPNDYKRIRIDVSWEGIARSKRLPMTLITDISPRTIEEIDNAGTLSILIFDSESKPVPQAQVTVQNDNANPPILITQLTNSNGRVTLPGSPVCENCYRIIATKAGYSTDRTYGEEEVTHPAKSHVSVLEGRLTEVGLSIDDVSTVTVRTVGSDQLSFPPLASIPFTITGNKIIGTDAADVPIPKFRADLVTDGDGSITIPNLEWDNYTIAFPPELLLDIASSTPLLPFTLPSGIDTEMVISLEPHSTHSLRLAFINQSDILVASVSAELNENGIVVASGSAGQAGFPNLGQMFFPDLEAKLYQLIATSPGYATYSGSIQVSGSSDEQIVLSLPQ